MAREQLRDLRTDATRFAHRHVDFAGRRRRGGRRIHCAPVERGETHQLVFTGWFTVSIPRSAGRRSLACGLKFLGLRGRTRRIPRRNSASDRDEKTLSRSESTWPSHFSLNPANSKRVPCFHGKVFAVPYHDLERRHQSAATAASAVAIAAFGSGPPKFQPAMIIVVTATTQIVATRVIFRIANLLPRPESACRDAGNGK